jgi:hypothetical protein
MKTNYFLIYCLLLWDLVGFTSQRADGRDNLSNEHFNLVFSQKGMAGLARSSDPENVEFINPGDVLGAAEIKYRPQHKEMRLVAGKDFDYRPLQTNDTPAFASQTVHRNALKITSRFSLVGEGLQWYLELENVSDLAIEILDIAVPLEMNTRFPKELSIEERFTKRVFRHAHIAGSGSFLFWLPTSGLGTCLVMMPDAQTHLEYFEDDTRQGGEYRVYIHSVIDGGEKQHGNWRQEHTSIKLQPVEKKRYGFQFFWANHYDGVREILYQNGGADILIVPGMVIPEDIAARFSLRTRNEIRKIVPEFPSETNVKSLGEKGGDHHIYQVEFSRLGENLLTVHYEDGRSTPMEFFVTQPLETLIKKRASFIVNAQQHRDPDKWYNGLFGIWDARREPGRNLLSPDDRGGQEMFIVGGSDDPSGGKTVLLSEKNIAYPDPHEIAALEYYLENFSWGKHQRTDQEHPYPYGIYGSEHWQENRTAVRDPIDEGVSRPGPGGSQCRMWRTFDYTHYILLYYNMYLIAGQNPEMVRYLDADGYLERAFGTAKAFFEVPYNIYMEGGWAFTGWTDWAYKQGNFHEKYLLKLMDALEKEGYHDKVDYLRGEWEKKVKYFLYDDPYPFVSEMPIDSTAFESSYAIAKYGMRRQLKPDKNLWQDKNTGQWYSHAEINPEIHIEFMEKQLYANLACRGTLETSYYHLGSDFRRHGSSFYCLSYMSQMGGWAVLDYALEFAEEPAWFLRLGYASLLSSWALVNAGDRESNHGFWFPGQRHDGSASWAFCPQKVGREGNRACWNKEAGGMPRGGWPICGEIDHGLTAGIETACTVVYDDPLFGLFAWGGNLTEKEGRIEVVCRDGVRQDIYYLKDNNRLQISLARDGFAKDSPVIFYDDLTKISFSLESRSPRPHATPLKIRGLHMDAYIVSANGVAINDMKAIGQKEATGMISMPALKEKGEAVHVTILNKYDGIKTLGN